MLENSVPYGDLKWEQSSPEQSIPKPEFGNEKVERVQQWQAEYNRRPPLLPSMVNGRAVLPQEMLIRQRLWDRCCLRECYGAGASTAAVSSCRSVFGRPGMNGLSTSTWNP